MMKLNSKALIGLGIFGAIGVVVMGVKSGKKAVNKAVDKTVIEADELVKKHEEQKRIYLDEATSKELGKAMGKKGGRPPKKKVEAVTDD